MRGEMIFWIPITDTPPESGKDSRTSDAPGRSHGKGIPAREKVSEVEEVDLITGTRSDFSRHHFNGKRTFHAPQPDRPAVSKSSEGRFGAGEVTIESNRGGAGHRLTLTVT
jgi:hypothetical protein